MRFSDVRVRLAGAASVVFLLSGSGANAATETVVYSFCSQKNCHDGSFPYAPLVARGGKLYGTAAGGEFQRGLVFSFIPGTGVENKLYAFEAARRQGAGPGYLLVRANTLYGLTEGGGFDNAGTVFSLDRRTGAETVMHSFESNGDGMEPLYSSLIDVDGRLYGTTQLGGTYGYGTVFSIDPKSGTERVLHSFQNNGTDGVNPSGGLIDVDGMLYGTTSLGGSPNGYGAVYAINPRTGAETVVYAFRGADAGDGSQPQDALLDYKGILYGTTETTVFSFDPGAGVETVLHQFEGEDDGYMAMSGLIHSNGMLYGTTLYGGGSGCGGEGCGAVYAIDPVNGAETVQYAFQDNGSDGTWPYAGLLEFRGALYGTTVFGGKHKYGTIFRITP